MNLQLPSSCRWIYLSPYIILFFLGVVGSSGVAKTLGVGLTEALLSTLAPQRNTIDDEEAGRERPFPSCFDPMAHLSKRPWWHFQGALLYLRIKALIICLGDAEGRRLWSQAAGTLVDLVTREASLFVAGR